MYDIDEQAIIDQVLEHMRKEGAYPSGNVSLNADGELHRYTIEGDSLNTKNGAYRIHTDGVPAWYFRDWKRGIEAKGTFNPQELSGTDKVAYTRRLNDKEYLSNVNRLRAEREKGEEQRKREATKKASELYDQAKPATLEHDYIKRKRLTHIKDFRLGEKGELLIPLHSASSPREFLSLQQIYANGGKYFFKDTSLLGACYEFIPEKVDDRLILIAEGIATAETLYRLTGEKYRVVCALNCNGLERVSKEIKKRFPRAEILIGADNDVKTYAKTGRNPGRSCAEWAVTCGNAKGILLPSFLPHQDGSDWNDYEELNGTDKARAEVLRQVDSVFRSDEGCETVSPQESVSDTDSSAGTPESEGEVSTAGKLLTDAERLNDFLAHVKERRDAQRITTGFPHLDEILNGGLYAGLYTIGANTGFGKTLFAVQVVNNIARSGHGVLIVSLEMSAYELMARSISRETFLASLTKTGTADHALEFREILQGKFNKTAKTGEILSEVCGDYGTWGENITTIEGIGDVTTEKIREAVTAYTAEHDGNPPVLLVDYVQLVASPDTRMSDKQRTDYNVTELKRISRDFAIPVIIVSSLNRDNYNEPISLSALKESGSLEYGSDVVMGLQIQGMRRKQATEKDAEYRIFVDSLVKAWRGYKGHGDFAPMELKILKHRAGTEGSVKLEILYNYYCAREAV